MTKWPSNGATRKRDRLIYFETAQPSWLTENRELPRCLLCRSWWHCRLSLWKLAVSTLSDDKVGIMLTLVISARNHGCSKYHIYMDLDWNHSKHNITTEKNQVVNKLIFNHNASDNVFVYKHIGPEWDTKWTYDFTCLLGTISREMNEQQRSNVAFEFLSQ